MEISELAVLFFLQFAFILAVIKLVGRLAALIGQPAVVGEMIAGVLLGPTLLGSLWPDLHARLFPVESMPIIYTISQLGLVLFMFLTGVEFDIEMIKKRKRHAAAVSLAGIITPFTLGGMLALLLLSNPGLFTPDIRPYEAFLFFGAAMSITAFPTLARNIHDRGLSKTRVGTLALAAGSIDDAAAWCLFAVVLASFGGDANVAIFAFGGGLIYALVVFFIVRPLLKRYLHPIVESQASMSGGTFTFVLMLLMLGAWFTDKVGIYAVFGAFILGMAMPRGKLTTQLYEKLHPISSYFLLPLFFVYSGLRTQLHLLTTASVISVSLLVLLVAIVGKGVACWAAARWSGEGKKESLIIGTFMNARGMMELVLINIGVERGIVTPTMFAVLVFMTVVTTMMVGPIFELITRRSPELAIRLRKPESIQGEVPVDS